MVVGSGVRNIKNPPANAEDLRDMGWVRSLDWEDPLEKGMTSILGPTAECAGPHELESRDTTALSLAPLQPQDSQCSQGPRCPELGTRE